MSAPEVKPPLSKKKAFERELVADADAIQDTLNELADALSEADKG